MAIIKTDDIDELFSELKYKSKITAPKPNSEYIELGFAKPNSEYIELELSEFASLVGPFGEYKIIQLISTSQLEYNEQLRTYFVNCAPFQPFVNDVIRAKGADGYPKLKLALKSATTDKIAIMHVRGVEVLKQAVNMTNLVSIDFVLDKENNVDTINSTGIRMKMNVLVDEFEMSDLFKKDRIDVIKGMNGVWSDWAVPPLRWNSDGNFHSTTKSHVTKHCEDAVARAVAQRTKEIEDQKTSKAEDEMSYKGIFSALTELSKMDSSLGTLDANDVISKFLSVIKKSD